MSLNLITCKEKLVISKTKLETAASGAAYAAERTKCEAAVAVNPTGPVARAAAAAMANKIGDCLEQLNLGDAQTIRRLRAL